MSDLNLQGTDFLVNIGQWIEDGIEWMEIPKYYVLRSERKEVREGRVLVPASWNFIKAVLTTTNYKVDEEYNRIEYIQGLRRLIIRNNDLIGTGIKLGQIDNQYGNMNGNYLYTSFTKGSVLFLYKGLPLDCDGFPMVPADAKVIEALNFWIIYKLGLMGFTHPVLSWDTAYKLWEKTYPAAGNSASWMTAQEYQEFTEMWNNIFRGDVSNSIEL